MHWRDFASGTSLDHFVAESLSGYVVRSSGQPAALRDVDAPDMGGRMAVSYRVPFRVRWHDARLQVKPNLRILYTAVTSQVFYRPRTFALLGVFLLLTTAFAGYGWRLKRSHSTHFGRA